MLTKEELEQSPLFENISYDEYRRMLSCFQAVQKSFRPDELIYDFSAPGSDAVGIVERGDAYGYILTQKMKEKMAPY